MTQIIEVPGQGPVEFPDGMSDAEITAVIKKNLLVAPQKPSMLQRLGTAAAQGATGGPLGVVASVGNLASSVGSEALGELGYNAGGKVTDVATNLGASPSLAAGAGTATNAAIQFGAPAVVGSIAGKAVAPAFDRLGKWAMKQAVRPSPDYVKSGDAKIAINTLLEKGINPTGEGAIFEGGMAKLERQIDALNGKVKSAIAGSNATVSKSDVANTIGDVVARIKKEHSTPQDSLKTVDKVYQEFLSNNLIPNDIPVQRAQELKQGIYRMLKDNYGEIAADSKEAFKALGRGYREGVSKAVPEVAALNAEESKLLTTLSVTERKALTDANRQMGGIAWLAHNPATFAAFMADKSALFKSIVARMLYSGQERIPQAVLGTGLAAAQGGLLGNQQPALLNPMLER